MGLGAMGSATTYQLAKRGARVLGIDRFSPPHAFGSSHGDTRVTRHAIGEGSAYVPLAIRSHGLWREIEAETGAELLTVNGCLVMSESSSGHSHVSDFLATTVNTAKQFGIEHEMLDADEVRRRFPQFQLTGEQSAYYEPGAGFLRPEKAIEAQLQLAQRYGAQIHREERVLSVRSSGSGVTVTTTQGQYGADQVVVAAGPWLSEFLGPEFARLFTVYRQLLHWFDINGPLEPMTPEHLPVFIWQLGSRINGIFYGFPAINGPGGGLKVATEQYEAQTDPDTVQREVAESEAAEMYDTYIRGRLPALTSRAVKSTACLYTVTRDFEFVIDRHPEQHNLIICSPCAGHGFKHSAAIGEVVAQMAIDGATAINIEPFSLRRFV